MKNRILLSIALLCLLMSSACGMQNASQEKDIAVQVAISLTQTAVSAKPAASPTAAAPANGTIVGRAGLMAPPTPAMTIYAVDPVSGKWFSTQAPANPNGTSAFSISVPPGSYQVFAGGSSSAYTTDQHGLSLVTVAAGQTVNDIGVAFIGQGDCGNNFAIPASPDGKYPAIPGPDPNCIPDSQANQGDSAPTLAPPQRIDVLPKGTWSTKGIMQPNTHPSFIFAGAKDKKLEVSVTLNPNNGASAFVNSAGGMIMASNITSYWTIKLPAKVDYVVGIDNNTQHDVSYTLTITLTN